ncbi:MAG: glycosyltransferase, partial [Bacteroidota bacterium]
IQIIHSHGRGAGVYSRLVGVLVGKTVIHTFHGWSRKSCEGWKRWADFFFEKIMSSGTDRYIFCSHQERDEALSCSLVNPSKTQVILNAIEVDNHIIPAIRTSDSLRIMHVSRFNEQKNSEEFLNIVSKAQTLIPNSADVIWEVYGEGEGLIKFKSKIRDAELSSVIRVHGAVDDLKDKMVGTALMISTSRWEGLPYALLEAMSLGIPVLASNVTGNSEVVTHGQNGYLYTLGNIDDAANYCQQIIQDKELRDRFSIWAHRMISEEFSLESFQKDLENTYVELLDT